MATLRQILRLLKRADVSPEEIFVSDDVYQDIIRQVRGILAEDNSDEDELSPGLD